MSTKNRCKSLLGSLTVAVAGVLGCSGALAAPDEIVVFADEFEKKGEIGLSVHLNYTARALHAGLCQRAGAVQCHPLDA